MGYISTLNKGDTGSMTDLFQTRLREVEQESRATVSLAWTSSTGGSRIRGSVPESLVNRLGPLATETATAAPIELKRK